MPGITPIGAYLLLLFALITLSLLSLFLYLLWWRRRLNAGPASPVSGEPHKSPSKERLYYLCWTNQSRIEPAGGGVACEAGSPEADEFEKMYSRSRFLYTINEEPEPEPEPDGEEEKRETETELEATAAASAEIDPQFFTPVSSPPFLTPTSSPPPAAPATAEVRMGIGST